MGLRFTKMHGAGNDFVIVDLRGGQAAPDVATVRAIATRLVGVASSTLSLNAFSQSSGSCSRAAVRKCSPGMYMIT